MTARDKREQAIRQAPAQVELRDLLALLVSEGFVCRAGSRGHYVCSHPQLPYTVGVPNPHPQRHVKPVYVKAALRMLDDARGRGRGEDRP